MKIFCGRCRITKETFEFNKDSTRKRGYNGFCRDCTTTHNKTEKSKENHYRWMRQNKVKISAYQKVNRAKKLGRLTKQACEVCQSENTHAHHDDYTKPLEVRWLCPACHKTWHKHNTPHE